ncbi:hypothetical protein SCLARK_001790 [Spiroplasma clarkii]|nr:hypothetical protein SCLARK_001790 [Spiroplasma clarkii]
MSWESYVKYELYTYLIAGFTFINMAVLSPYFVSALYGNLAASSLSAGTDSAIMDTRVFEFMFFNPRFSILYAATTALIIMCEAQTTIIQAKGRYAEVSKFQNYLGFSYVVAAFVITYIINALQLGGENCLVIALGVMYGLKIITLLIRYMYLWAYVWKYATYNSNFKYVANNFAILITPIILISILNVYLLNPYLGVAEYATGDAKLGPLVALFFSTIAISTVGLLLMAYAFSPKMMNGIIQNLPIISSFLSKKAEAMRQQRFEEYGIDKQEIVDNSNQLAAAMYAIDEKNFTDTLDIDNDHVEIVSKNAKIYVLKGKE